MLLPSLLNHSLWKIHLPCFKGTQAVLWRQMGTTSAGPNVGLKLMNCEIMTWAETKNRTINQPSHPGASMVWVFFFNILNHTIFSFPLALCVSVWFCLIKCSLCMKPLTAGTSQLLRKYWRTVRKMAKQCTNLKAGECLRDKNIHTFNTLCFHNTNYRSKSLTNLHRRASLPQPGWVPLFQRSRLVPIFGPWRQYKRLPNLFAHLTLSIVWRVSSDNICTLSNA